MTHDSNDVNDLGQTESSRDTVPTDPTDPTDQTDPNDEVPVPIAMWPSEIDERAQVVEALRGNGPPPRTDTQVDPTTESRGDQI